MYNAAVSAASAARTNSRALSRYVVSGYNGSGHMDDGGAMAEPEEHGGTGEGAGEGGSNTRSVRPFSALM